MEVFEIERVIVNLIDCRAIKGGSTDFKLYNRNDARQNKKNICTFAHARDRKFEEDIASPKARNGILEKMYLVDPSLPLLVF